MKSKITTKEMCEGPLTGPIIRYTIPIILTGFLQLLFNTADLLVVGWGGNETSVAAVGATGSLTSLIVNFFMGLSIGAGVVVAHGLGSHDDRKVQQTVHTAIPVAIICGAFLTVIGVTCSGLFLEWMGTPANVIGQSKLYMQIYFCGMIFNLVQNFGASILRAGGDTTGPMVYLTIAGLVNLLLNMFFVLVLHIDVAGVALATSISQAVAALLIVRALMKRTDACRLNLKEMGIHRAPLFRMFKIGIPAGIQSALFAISNVTIQSSINSFGSLVLSGNTAAANLESFVYMVMHSFNQTVMNFTGQNTGAHNYKRIGRIYRRCLLMVALFGGGLALLIYLCGEPLLLLYVPKTPEAVEFGMVRLSCICITYFLCGMMEVANGAVRGMGVSFSPMVITVLGVCGLRIGWVYTVFRQFRELWVLYISYPISWILTFFAISAVFFGVLHTRQKRLAVK